MGQVSSTSFKTLQSSFYVIFLTHLLYRARLNYKFRIARKNCAKKVILVTGCDSGLGFKLIHHARELGFTVFAACINAESDGAKLLRAKWNDVKILEMNLTSKDSITAAFEQIESFLKNNEDYVLWSVINNAGILVFGEFEWQTDEQISNQISINQLGTMNVTQKTLPLLHRSKTYLKKSSPRIITITSHCAFEPLPGLSVYAASKAALVAWIDGLRCEMRPHGICVTQIVPGRVIGTKLMCNTRAQSHEMWENMTEEQREYYGEHFKRYYSYLDESGTSEATFPSAFDKSDKQLREAFEHALFDEPPLRKYLCEPWQYAVYRIFATLSPTAAIRDYITVKFIRTPQWKPKNK